MAGRQPTLGFVLNVYVITLNLDVRNSLPNKGLS